MRTIGSICRPYLVVTMLVFSTLASAKETPSPTITKRPTLVESAQPFPADALAEGHNGTVLISATLTEAGRVEDARVKRTSGSSVLDQAALAAVKDWKLTPALDASGNPVRFPITLNLEYTKAFEVGYTCSQFVIDSVWFDTVRGKENREDLRIYKTIRGYSVIAAMRAGNPSSLQNLNFDVNWDRLIDYCRKNPNRNFQQSWQKFL